MGLGLLASRGDITFVQWICKNGIAITHIYCNSGTHTHMHINGDRANRAARRLAEKVGLTKQDE